LMVDWSGASSPSTGENSIWCGYGEWSDDQRLNITTTNPRTRRAAVDEVVEWCSTRSGKRVLVGFDFAFGYPSGLANAAQLPNSGGRPPWAALHDYLGNLVVDRDSNAHNLYELAATLNEKLNGGGPGPFWGCPANKECDTLTTRRIGRFAFPYAGLNEWRLTDAQARKHATPQSVWKLNCGVSVGGQTILGIHRLHQIRGELGERALIWPFETGWQLPVRSDAVVIAEIFPSVVPMLEAAKGEVKDQRQARSCVWHAARMDAHGTIASAFAPPPRLSALEASRAASEEGWILFLPSVL
jgi:hypothetical protein